MNAISEKISMSYYPTLINLIDSLKLEEITDVKLRIIFNRNDAFNSFFRQELNIDINVPSFVPITSHIKNGLQLCSINTDYGNLKIELNSLNGYLSNTTDHVECFIQVPNEHLNNVSVDVMFVPEYTSFSNDTWRSLLLTDDLIIIVLDPFHILFSGEKDFLLGSVIPITNNERLYFAIANSEAIKSSEWGDIEQRITTQLGKSFQIFPIFSDDISQKVKGRYPNNGYSFNQVFDYMREHALEVRKMHHHDIDSYLTAVFTDELLKKKEEISALLDKGKDKNSTLSLNEEQIIESKKHILDTVSLFLESSSAAVFNNDIDAFSEKFQQSINDDIDSSIDIKKDARILPRYMAYIWEKFAEDENVVVNEHFKRETSLLFDMIRLDLNRLASNIPIEAVREKINSLLDGKFSVNTFFARKVSGDAGVTEALTVGGAIYAIFFNPAGWIIVAVSEAMKYFGKEAMENSFKRELSIKVNDIILTHAEQIKKQAEIRFKEASELFKVEIISFYDELLSSIAKILDEENERIKHADYALALIDSYLNK